MKKVLLIFSAKKLTWVTSVPNQQVTEKSQFDPNKIISSDLAEIGQFTPPTFNNFKLKSWRSLIKVWKDDQSSHDAWFHVQL